MKNPSNYGEMIANYIGGTLWSYDTYGDYTGDYIAIIYKDSNLLIYKGYYGSCSGCDWLDGWRDDENYSEEELKDYMKNRHPFAEIPADSLPKTVKNLKALLPANTRVWLKESYNAVTLKGILNQIKSPVCDNLDLLENEAKGKGLV